MHWREENNASFCFGYVHLSLSPAVGHFFLRLELSLGHGGYSVKVVLSLAEGMCKDLVGVNSSCGFNKERIMPSSALFSLPC